MLRDIAKFARTRAYGMFLLLNVFNVQPEGSLIQEGLAAFALI